MRILFAGTPEVAVPSLEALVAAGHEVVRVITRADAPVGRKRVLTPSPIAVAAERLGLDVVKTRRLTADDAAALAGLGVDVGVVVAFGGMIREPLLRAPVHGFINLHFSDLPRWRGASPVQSAIWAGDTTTAITVFELIEQLDAGPILASEPVAIEPEETAGALLARLAHPGADLIVRTVGHLEAGTAQARPQLGDVTLARKLVTADGAIDATATAAREHARIRAVTPDPGAYVTIDGARMRVVQAALSLDGGDVDDGVTPGTLHVVGKRVMLRCADRDLEIITVQPAGKRAMSAIDWMRGRATERILIDGS